MFLGKGVLKRCSKFTGEYPCRSAISIKLLCNFIEITLRHGCSPVNLLLIFRTPFARKQVTASVLCPFFFEYLHKIFLRLSEHAQLTKTQLHQCIAKTYSGVKQGTYPLYKLRSEIIKSKRGQVDVLQSITDLGLIDHFSYNNLKFSYFLIILSTLWSIFLTKPNEFVKTSRFISTI